MQAYTIGLFPMASHRVDPTIHWVAPNQRGILPLDGFHVSRRLARTIRMKRFQICVDHNFEAVIENCAAPRPGRPETWINDEIARVYGELFHRGVAHSVETWRDGRLVGGLYGVSLGSAFFGESMFSVETDASKVALVYLVAILRHNRFSLLDIQFITDHLRQFGAIEIPAAEYLQRLEEAIQRPVRFNGRLSGKVLEGAVAKVLTQSSNQRS
jgi:leucyl/phenylalanyl-tRNA--protein transferase